MGKKIKVRNNKQIFQEIKAKLQSGNYRDAANSLRKTKFPPQEKKKADQLNISIHYLWALEFFQQKNYLQAISTLRMFVERYKNKINLPLEKANMLLGLSYLYLNDFEKAGTYLKTAKKEPATRPFYFYYLLGLIYQKKYADFNTLLIEHESRLTAIAAHQKQYLEIAFALVNADFDKANALLTTYKAINKNQANNLLAIKTIISGENFNAEKKALKPLYKSLFNIELADSEKQYLSKIPQFKERTDQHTKNQLKTNLSFIIKKLCENGEALSKEELAKCIDLPENYFSYIVYNQVAALYNEDIEETEEEIVALLKKYSWHFFQVPESVLLFAQIIYWDPDNFTSNFFWQGIEIGLERFGTSYTALQLNRLSWSLLGCLQYSDFADKKMLSRKQQKLSTKYPQMLGLKWWQILDSSLTPNMDLSESALDIFTHPNFQHGKRIAKGKLESALEEIYPSPGLIHSYLQELEGFNSFANEELIESKVNEMYSDFLYKIQNALVRATTEHDVHLKNKVILDLFKVTHHFIHKFELENEFELIKTKKAAFFKAYQDMIVLFEEDHPDSEYFQDYQLVENAPKLLHLTQVIRNEGVGKTLIDLYHSHLKVGESHLIHKVLIDEFLLVYLRPNILEAVFQYFRILVKQTDIDLATIVRQFGNNYIKVIRLPHVPKYPDTNFFIILKEMLKGTSPNEILAVSTLTEVYASFLTRTVEPLYFNMAEKILHYFIKVHKKHPNFEFNKALIKELKLFVKKAVEERKLKKLGATLADAEKVFI